MVKGLFAWALMALAVGVAGAAPEVVCEDGVCRIVDAEADAAPADKVFFPGYEVVANGMGEMDARQVVSLLEGKSPERKGNRKFLGGLALAFLGGILLNLTPCVLPLIPVTLMMLGMGARGRARRPATPGGEVEERTRKSARPGVAYGLGIAVAYGALGLLSVFAGLAFGTLQSSPWFSAAVAVAMVALALAMFGVFSVDFARFRRKGAGAAMPFMAGMGFALLAGACVAPVVLQTLVMAAAWPAAVAWMPPLALGLGMGAPWMLLGEGMARWMPKPGAWMMWVERAFGIVAVAFAVHYGRLAWAGFRGGNGGAEARAEGGIEWLSDADEAFLEAEMDGKPIFVDLWATWCRSCEAMERGALREPEVVEAMAGCVPLRLQAEDPNSPEAVALFRELGFNNLRGLPAMALLKRRD